MNTFNNFSFTCKLDLYVQRVHFHLTWVSVCFNQHISACPLLIYQLPLDLVVVQWSIFVTNIFQEMSSYLLRTHRLRTIYSITIDFSSHALCVIITSASHLNKMNVRLFNKAHLRIERVNITDSTAVNYSKKKSYGGY